MSSSSASQPAMTRDVRPLSYAEAGPASAGDPPSRGALPFPCTPEEREQWEQAARDAGRREGEERARLFFERQMEQLREPFRAALEHFEVEKREYYFKVETEAVKLALAIARKILHRELQMDPMVLAGIVRVALGQLEDAGTLTLRVSPLRLHEWREYFRKNPKSGGELSILEDPNLAPDSCVLETAVGVTEFGIYTPLEEIEKGFADLLEQRPK